MEMCQKLVFISSQEIEYLGFIVNPVTITVRLTTEKKRKIFDLCQEVLLKVLLVSKLLGKFSSSFQSKEAIKNSTIVTRNV